MLHQEPGAAAALTMLEKKSQLCCVIYIYIYTYIFRVDGRRRRKKGVAMFLYLYRGGRGSAYKYRRHLCRIDLLLRTANENKY